MQSPDFFCTDPFPNCCTLTVSYPGNLPLNSNLQPLPCHHFEYTSMLEELWIKDFALIREVRIAFGPGLNLITGETGAGKSILLGALNLALGGKASTDMIRSGSPRAFVEAVFSLPGAEKTKDLLTLLAEHGLDSEDSTLILRREITAEAKSRSFVNSRNVPSTLVREISRHLVDIHGQNEHQNILRTDTHRQLLDRFAGLSEQTETFRRLFKEREDRRQKLQSVSLDENEKNRRLELLRHEIGEIEAARLKENNELEEIENQENSLANAESIVKELSIAFQGLQESDESVLSHLSQIERNVEHAVQYEPGINQELDSLREARYLLEDAAARLRSKAEKLEPDPEKLQILRERIDVLNGLLRRYGKSIAEVKSYHERAVNELAGIELSSDEEQKLRKEIKELTTQLIEKARVISERRNQSAEQLEKMVQRELKDLGMEDTRIRISLKWELSEDGDFPDPEGGTKKYALGSSGLEIVELLLGSGADETLRPLRKIASGGEMSRIMLALKKVIIDSDPVFTMLFDEVDTGVGGGIAEAVGQKLAELASRAQVVVITHLHQIAGLSVAGTVHFKVAKDREKGTSLTRLNPDQRLHELARMISGSEVTDTALEHARALLKNGDS